jgi:hypothetical protein
MKRPGNKDRTSTETTIPTRMGLGSWIILIVLPSLLVATGVVICLGWTLGNGTDVPTSGYAAMALGVIFRWLSGSVSWRYSFTVAEKDMTSRL